MRLSFNGHGWEELAIYWQLHETVEREEKLLKKVQHYLRTHQDEETRKTVEAFLIALIREEREIGDNAPFFESFLKIKSNHDFFRLVSHNLCHLWT